jgi:hypothetical protein
VGRGDNEMVMKRHKRIVLWIYTTLNPIINTFDKKISLEKQQSRICLKACYNLQRLIIGFNHAYFDDASAFLFQIFAAVIAGFIRLLFHVSSS